MADTWSVEVKRNGESILVIGSESMSGRVPFDEDDEDAIYTAGKHLLAFVEPKHTYHQPATDESIPF